MREAACHIGVYKDKEALKAGAPRAPPESKPRDHFHEPLLEFGCGRPAALCRGRTTDPEGLGETEHQRESLRAIAARHRCDQSRSDGQAPTLSGPARNAVARSVGGAKWRKAGPDFRRKRFRRSFGACIPSPPKARCAASV